MLATDRVCGGDFGRIQNGQLPVQAGAQARVGLSPLQRTGTVRPRVAENIRSDFQSRCRSSDVRVSPEGSSRSLRRTGHIFIRTPTAAVDHANSDRARFAGGTGVKGFILRQGNDATYGLAGLNPPLPKRWRQACIGIHSGD